MIDLFGNSRKTREATAVECFFLASNWEEEVSGPSFVLVVNTEYYQVLGIKY